MKHKVAIVTACAALLGLLTLGVLMARSRASWHANETFADALLDSARSGTALHGEVLSSNDRQGIAAQRQLIAGVARRVVLDETAGTMEVGYCFPSGSYAYVTFPTDGDPPKPSTFAVHESGSPFARTCDDLR